MATQLTSIIDQEAFTEILRRIDTVEPGSSSQWGSMTAAQMFAHCAEVQEVTNGKPLVGTPFFVKLLGPFIKKMVLSDKPYPKGTNTHPQYVQNEPREFAKEKQRLIAALNRFMDMSDSEHAKSVHALFGAMSTRDKGRAAYKHLDHHLKQFGV